MSTTLRCDDSNTIKWCVDASFAVHQDFKSHTGAHAALGKGAFVTMSTKQKSNAKSSTEAESVGADDASGQVIWTRHFLEAQGCEVKDDIVFQDNESAVTLEKNGLASAGKRSRHINIRCFFLKDRISKGEVTIKCCPTDEMIGDYFTKPLQGGEFKKFRNETLGANFFMFNYKVTKKNY